MRYRFYLWIAFIAWTILTLSEARKSSKKRKSNPTGLGGNQVPQETLSNSGPISHLGESGPQSPTGLTGTKRTKRQSDQREEGRQMGPPGRPGIPGPPGSLGPQGPPGLPGLKGESGDWGLPGVPGEKGTPGIPGMFGMKGEKGTLGAQGFPGEPGIDGRPGPRGFPGLPGYPGYSRDQGSEGPSDKSGPPGPPGPPGLPGLPGPQGLRGEQGYPGEYGMPGMKGEPGKRGPTGPPGPPGLPGLPAILSKINTQNDPDILVQGDQPVPKVFGNELSIHETQELLNKVLEQLKASFENNKKPNEDKKDPFKTCRDILAAHPDSGSGKYWVDPNGGDSKDWILVYCDMEKKATCVMPSPARSQEIRYVGNEPEIWLGEMEIGIQFTYKADSTQIDHLHLLSTRATQNITYHCRNSVAYYDLATQSYRKGIKLVSYNDVEITPEDSRLKYVGVVDECKYSGDSWAQSVLEFTTNKPSRLPITDVGVRDIGKSNQAFWIEIGAACFY